MGAVDLPYVVTDIDRNGNIRVYIRLPRQKKLRVRVPVGSAAFFEIYNAAIAGAKSVVHDRAPAGSFRALCDDYVASKRFKALDPSTQAWRERAMNAICTEYGSLPAASLRARHIRQILDAIADRPVVANQRLKALRALFRWAVNYGEVDVNPARDVERFFVASEGHHTWTIEEVERFEAKHPIGSKARLALAIMLYTGCRREDAIRLGPQHIRQGRIVFTQAKNEHRRPIQVSMPLHPHLAAIIEASRVEHLTFLVTEYGRPFTVAGFGNWFRDCCQQAGVPGRAHGLRKAMGARLANAGATPSEMKPVLGHTTLEQVDVYARHADEEHLTDAAFEKLRKKGW